MSRLQKPAGLQHNDRTPLSVGAPSARVRRLNHKSKHAGLEACIGLQRRPRELLTWM